MAILQPLPVVLFPCVAYTGQAEANVLVIVAIARARAIPCDEFGGRDVPFGVRVGAAVGVGVEVMAERGDRGGEAADSGFYVGAEHDVGDPDWGGALVGVAGGIAMDGG